MDATKTTFKAGFEKLNKDIERFPHVFPITEDMHVTYEGVSRLVMLDRYSYKDATKETLSEGDLVILTVKEDPKYPARGTGTVLSINHKDQTVRIKVSEEYQHNIDDFEVEEGGIVTRRILTLDKPLELFYEQIAMRNAHGLAEVEITPELRHEAFLKFYEEQKALNFIPAGRVLYGAGSGTDVTYFNCYVMPFVPDSRGGISDHRKKVMEIMSRGGGVGSNGSTLRPRHTIVKGVNGRSSGSVSWMDDIAKLTHLVEQGGSRRGAQMIMLADWHPDIFEFIISKMQNPRILRYIIENFEDEQIRMLAKEKLHFTPFSPRDINMYTGIVNYKHIPGHGGFDASVIHEAEKKLRDGGTYTVNNPEFLTGANISVCITDDFMDAVMRDEAYALRFPDVEHYDADAMAHYDAEWTNCGDVRDWEAAGNAVRTYRTVNARELWRLINVCATYAAEPGIFFIDNANKMTNAIAYGQKVVATNPCGEQPLAAYSVCNLAAVNLAEMVNKDLQMVDFAKLEQTVRTGVHMQDNVIDSTPYFLEENKKQALGERRVGLGIMGLADMLIYCGIRYGSLESLQLIDQVFETIAVAAYEESIELAKARGSFPFLVGQTGKETQILRECFINTGYMKKMPEHVREGVLKYGIRNSHLLTVAPTGSTGTMAGVSTGLEPYFSFTYYRSGRLGKFIEVKAEIVQEYLDRHPGADPNQLPDYFVAAMTLSPEEHVDVQTTIQRWVDSSISKTVNAPKGYTVDQVEKIYERLYLGGAKGGTVYVDGSRDSQVLTLKAEENVWDEEAKLEEEKEHIKINKDKTFLVDSIANLASTDVTIGNEIGDTCPICRQGTVEDLGGCNTCTNCGAQLKCGL
ncbi:vitamin B12-dependent ribonucleotide reductase [Trichococcus pasteurii]|uniref:Vitamin B12-dependent ribonucleotide reductase n=1 Tax=Trichococcus pasteurii TaxID=43064 RepID=A0A1W1IH96_9LACT|nr:vitamin B12-dependent ribonucleotide reductase [Trichococcus pasteurii]SFE55226.1 ribonucleoside-diphosphate reductase class II [Trichococcus pasteurii]SLM52336.1 ribonucleotide reductase large chain signature [Trichococcus pasteurii]SSB93217.1 ribonucleotide reductase large chain signature [Trichococcus pasteurii]